MASNGIPRHHVGTSHGIPGISWASTEGSDGNLRGNRHGIRRLPTTYKAVLARCRGINHTWDISWDVARTHCRQPRDPAGSHVGSHRIPRHRAGSHGDVRRESGQKPNNARLCPTLPLDRCVLAGTLSVLLARTTVCVYQYWRGSGRYKFTLLRNRGCASVGSVKTGPKMIL